MTDKIMQFAARAGVVSEKNTIAPAADGNFAVRRKRETAMLITVCWLSGNLMLYLPVLKDLQGGVNLAVFGADGNIAD